METVIKKKRGIKRILISAIIFSGAILVILEIIKNISME